MLAIVFRVFAFFVLIALGISAVGFVIIRYILPIFSRVEREEGKVYKKWKKIWRLKW